MTRRQMLGRFTCGALLAVAVLPLRASDPIGVYSIVDRIVIEPAGSRPAAVQVWGSFSMAVPRSRDGRQTKPANSFGSEQNGDVYGAIQKGYLYCTCPAGKETTCLREWNELKAAAGSNAIVGFGARYGALPRVRAASDSPASPDEYPLNTGVVKMGASYPANADLAAALTAAAKSR